MRILVGKSKIDILNQFMERLDINDNHTFYQLVEYLEKPKMHLTMRWKHRILLWAMPLLIIGLSLTISLIWEMSDGGFPWLIDNFEGFKGKFINIIQAGVMFGSCIFMIIFPLVKLDEHYNWDW